MSVFFNIEEINLSGHRIKTIEDFDTLKNLKTLNLSCNDIRILPDLSALRLLKRLNLSSNKIVSIVKLKLLASANIELESLDLADNRIANLKELKCLESLKFLKNVYFHKNEDESNPICANLNLYYSEFLLLNRNSMTKIDDHTSSEVSDLLNSSKSFRNDNIKVEALKPIETNEKSQQSERPDILKAEPQQKSQQQKPDVLISKYQQLNELNRKLISQQSLNLPKSSNDFCVDDEEQMTAQHLPSHLLPKNHKLVPENNDKFQINNSKTSPLNLERKVVELNDLLSFKDLKHKEKEFLLNESLATKQEKIDSLQKDFEKLNNEFRQTLFENDQLKERISFVMNEINKRSSTETNIFDKLEKEQKNNFELSKKLENLMNQNDKLEKELKAANERGDKMAYILSQKDEQIEVFRDNSIKISNDTQTKNEIYDRRVFNLEETISNLKEELQSLHYAKMTIDAQENGQLQSLKIQFEKEKFELEKKFNNEIISYKEQITGLYHQQNKEKDEMEKEFQNSLIRMEEEFKSVIIELNNKNSDYKKECANLKVQNVR